MDIRHFSYFVSIVDCDCNLSAAAEKIHISQSALSKIVRTFEEQEQIELFVRKNGRLNGLTPAGKIFYDACIDITKRYELAMKRLRQTAYRNSGQLRVGIPPMILTVGFSSVLADFRKQFPNITLEIVEAGAEVLGRMFRDKELDFAVILAPTKLNDPGATEYALFSDMLVAFMSRDNVLAKREIIEWSDLEKHSVALFNESFSINRLTRDKCREKGIKPNIEIMSGSWDFMLETVQSSDYLTIMPNLIMSYASREAIAAVPFNDPIPWEVIMAEHDEEADEHVHNLFREFTLDYFSDASGTRAKNSRFFKIP